LGGDIGSSVRRRWIALSIALAIAAVGAGLAERALERADHRITGIRRQVAVAAFAVRSQREHVNLP